MPESENKMDASIFTDLERQISSFLRTEKEYSIVLESLESLTTQPTDPKATPGKDCPRHPKKQFCARWNAVEDVNTKAGSRKAKSSVLGERHRRAGPYKTYSVRNPSASTDLTSNQDFSNREGVAPNHDASVKYQRHEDTDSDREPKPVCVSSLTPAESTPKETSGKAFPRPRHLKKELCQRWKAVEDVNTKNGSRKAKSSVLGDGHKRRGPYQASSVRKNPLVTTDLHSTQRKEETSGSLNSPPKQKGSETDEKTKPVCVSDYDEMKGTKRSRPISPFRPNKKWKPSKDYCRYERKVKRLIRCFRKFSIDG